MVAGINFGEQPDWVYDAAEAGPAGEASTTLKTITVPALSLLGGLFAYRMLNPSFRSRNAVERILMVLAARSHIAILTTIGIVFSVIFRSLRFFALVPVSEFLFGLTWNPQFEGASAGSGQMGLATYGSVPLFAGTLLISVVALSVSVPVGLLSAIYLSEYASPRVRIGEAIDGASGRCADRCLRLFRGTDSRPLGAALPVWNWGWMWYQRVRVGRWPGHGHHDYSARVVPLR